MTKEGASKGGKANSLESLSRAGKLGGAKTRELGHDHFVSIGSKGGESTLAKMGREFYRENGLKGGAGLKSKYGNERFAEMARLRWSKVKAKKEERGSDSERRKVEPEAEIDF